MCGIAGVHIKGDTYFENPERYHTFLERFVNELLLGIESRGRHATGLAVVGRDGKKVAVDKEPVKASEFIKTRKPLPENTRTVLGHARWATQGPVEHNENNHPVMYGTVFLTHNGVIINDDRFFKDEELKRYAEVDTEAIAALVNKFGWDGLKENLHKLHGGYAFAAVDPVHEAGKVVLVKGPTYPLVLHENKQFVVWASEATAIRRAWANVLSKEGAEHIDFKFFNEGDIAWIEGSDVSIEREAFEPHTYATSNYYDRQAWNGCGLDDDPTDDEEAFYKYAEYEAPDWETTLATKGSRYNRNNTYTVLDLERPVEARVASGAGSALVMDHKAHPKKSWIRCPHCTRMVDKTDTRESAVWDIICTDCNWFAVNHRYLNTKVKVSEAFRKEIEEWADLENEAHRYAIEATSYATGLMPNAVFYLTQLDSDDKWLSKNKTAKRLRDEIVDLYDEFLQSAWENELDSADEKPEEKPVEKSAAEKPMIQHVLENGAGKSLHPDTDEAKQRCKWCNPVSTPEEVQEAIEQLVDIDLEKNDWRFTQCNHYSCTKGGQVTHTNGLRYCVTHLAELAERERSIRAQAEQRKTIAEAESRYQAAKQTKEVNKCGYKKCRRKATHYLGTLFRFCDTHIDKCSGHKCKGKPVATMSTNARLCHNHARGMKGAIFDNDEQSIKQAEQRRIRGNARRQPVLH